MEAEDQTPPKHAGGRPTLYRPEYCDQVEEQMGKGYSLTAFAGIIGVNRDTIDAWRHAHPEFSEAVTRAKAKRLMIWETLAMKVAKDGGGAGSGTVVVFGLKNMGGDEWRDKSEAEVYGKDGGPVQVQRVERVIVDPASR